MLNKKLLGSVSAPPAEYVEDVFSTYLYTGNGSTQTITNNVDLAGDGGLVWIKDRNSGAKGHALFDTARGVNKKLQSQSTTSESDFSGQLTNFNADGFTLGSAGDINSSSTLFCSWTFRKAKKFFDVVTYTGTGVARNINHNLGSVPGMIIIKLLNQSSDWVVYHRSLPNTDYLYLNATNGSAEVPDYWNDTTPNSSTFRVNTNSAVNEDGQPYIAYLFAHNAGGFGTAGTDNVISCGSYVGDGTNPGPAINLGFEPQWLLVKNTTTGGNNWLMYDVMRGMPSSTTNTSETKLLRPNTSDAESGGATVSPTATGFQLNTTFAGANESGSTYIYMAIRRPMKAPTTGTSVFNPTAAIPASPNTVTTGFASDTLIVTERSKASGLTGVFVADRLRGTSSSAFRRIATNQTGAESNVTNGGFAFDRNTSIQDNYLNPVFSVGSSTIYWNFRRATGFMDVVCYNPTGTSGQTYNHNLGAVPELMIIRNRPDGGNWGVYAAPIGNTNYLYLNSTQGITANSSFWNDTTPTSTVFTLGNNAVVNGNPASWGGYVAYLFATLAGVSKVGSYTGNGSNQTINCGFTAGARFVLIKRTDSTGDWCVFDTARGIVSGNDPFLELNTTAAEQTGEDAVDPANSGFIINETTEALNTNAATYIFLAIA
jgi:hypothetical protein